MGGIVQLRGLFAARETQVLAQSFSARFPFPTRIVEQLAYGKDLKGGAVPGIAQVPGHYRIRRRIVHSISAAESSFSSTSGKFSGIQRKVPDELKIEWPTDQTKRMYKYLSMQTHTMPMSFHRTEINRVYTKEGKSTKALAGFAIEHAYKAFILPSIYMSSPSNNLFCLFAGNERKNGLLRRRSWRGPSYSQQIHILLMKAKS